MNHLKKYEELDWFKKLTRSAKPQEVGREPLYGKPAASGFDKIKSDLVSHFQNDSRFRLHDQSGSDKISLNLSFSQALIAELEKVPEIGPQISKGHIWIKVKPGTPGLASKLLPFNVEVGFRFDTKSNLLEAFSIGGFSYEFDSFEVLVSSRIIGNRNEIAFTSNNSSEVVSKLEDICSKITGTKVGVLSGFYANLKHQQRRESEARGRRERKRLERQRQIEEEEKRKKEEEKRVAEFQSKVDEVEDFLVELYDMSEKHTKSCGEYRMNFYFEIKGIRLQGESLMFNDTLEEVYRALLQAQKRIKHILGPSVQLWTIFRNDSLTITIGLEQKPQPLPSDDPYILDYDEDDEDDEDYEEEDDDYEEEDYDWDD